MRFRELITEFRQLFEHFELPSFFSEPEFQIAFLNNLITELLVEKPIMLNSGKIRSRNANSHKESYENILSRTKGSEIFSIESIYFTYFQNYGSLEDPDFSTYCAVCVNQDQNKIVIPIEFNSWQTVFSNKPEYDDVLKI